MKATDEVDEPMRQRPAPARNPDAALRTLGLGTRDWKAVLCALLAKNNHLHSSKRKVISFETRHDRGEFLFAFWKELRSQTRYSNLDPRSLANRHVQVMVDRWVARGLATSTIHQYLSYLRTYAQWIGKPGMVHEPAHYLTAAPRHAMRRQAATTDRSWVARNVDISAKIGEVAAFDPWVALQLELCWRFGLRANEARHFRPHEPLLDPSQAFARDAAAYPEVQFFVRVHRGTKGGRPRDVPVTTPEQLELLGRLRTAVARGAFVGDPSRSHLQAQNRFYYVLRKFGITHKQLGVVAHGLRHQRVNDDYERDLGEPSPVRGGAERSEEELLARDRASRMLGHGRRQVTSAYLGAAVQTGRLSSSANRSGSEGADVESAP